MNNSLTMRQCPKTTTCEFTDCPHFKIHKHQYDCIRDRRDDCPTCSITKTVPKKIRHYDTTNRKEKV